ncbi:hypothetical protein FACS1894122_07630 [Alphaproteobacteria bacterium]|nr:hypothetical protein FACS1894122_07630 [Alphaproteobacteria bacterium]
MINFFILAMFLLFSDCSSMNQWSFSQFKDVERPSVDSVIRDDSAFINFAKYTTYAIVDPLLPALPPLEKGISPGGFYQVIRDVQQPLVDNSVFTSVAYKCMYVSSLALSVYHLRRIVSDIKVCLGENFLNFHDYEKRLNDFESYLKMVYKCAYPKMDYPSDVRAKTYTMPQEYDCDGGLERLLLEHSLKK